MKKEIIKVFNEGNEAELPLEDVRGGRCFINLTQCEKGNDEKCNSNKCIEDKGEGTPTDPKPQL